MPPRQSDGGAERAGPTGGRGVMSALPRRAGRAAPEAGRRVRAIRTPVVPLIAELTAHHPGTLSLGQGVVCYGPPPAAREALEGFFAPMAHHRYGPVEGQPALLDALRRKLDEENGLDMGPGGSRVMVTAGSNMAFLQTVLAITDPGDEIILPLPWYFNHEMAVRMADAQPVEVPTGSDYQPDPGRIEAAITARTRAIVTVSPNNPSGAVYSPECLRAINALAARHGLYHISDEAYEYFVYDGKAHCSPGALPGAAAHTVSLYSLSKAYGMAGWRIGYAALPPQLYPEVQKIQDTNVICPALASQQAALGALRAGRAYCLEGRRQIELARRHLLEALQPLQPFCEPPRADGALYVLLGLHSAMDSMDLAGRLIREHGVAVIPGSAFGLDTGQCHLRISYGALGPDTLAPAVERLTGGLRALLRGEGGRSR